jgi:hypothetical protein
MNETATATLPQVCHSHIIHRATADTATVSVPESRFATTLDADTLALGSPGLGPNRRTAVAFRTVFKRGVRREIDRLIRLADDLE